MVGRGRGRKKEDVNSSQNRTEFGIYCFRSCSRDMNVLRKISLFSILPTCREGCTSEALVLFKRRKHAQGVHH